MALGLTQFLSNAHFSEENLPELQVANSMLLQARIRMGGTMPLGPPVNCMHEKESLLEDKMEVLVT